ncbi:hypothetical protein ACFL1K_04015 [Candidatus Omnitrophota bacterium]
MLKYRIDFVLRVSGYSTQELRDSIIEFGEDVKISPLSEDLGSGADFRIQVLSEEPGLVFDACAQFGRLKSVKIEEERRQ